MGPVASRKKILTKKDIDTPHYDQQIGIRPTKRMKVIDRWERHEQNTIRGMSGEALQARLLCVDCMPSFFPCQSTQHINHIADILAQAEISSFVFFLFQSPLLLPKKLNYSSKKTGDGKCLNLDITRLLGIPSPTDTFQVVFKIPKKVRLSTPWTSQTFSHLLISFASPRFVGFSRNYSRIYRHIYI